MAGLLTTGAGNALGAEKVIKKIGSALNTRIVDLTPIQHDNGTVTLVTALENGTKVVQDISPPEAVPLKVEEDIGTVKYAPLNITIREYENETETNEFLETTNKDDGVQKLLAGKEYKVDAAHEIFDRENDGHDAVLILEVEQESHIIKIDMNGKKVKTIEEFG